MSLCKFYVSTGGFYKVNFLYTSRLFPPGNRHSAGRVAARASARSILIPFSRPRKVGGNRENIPKKTVFPACALPSTVKLRTFSSLMADSFGESSKVNFFHCFPIPWPTTVDAYTVPCFDLRETVTGPAVMSEDA